MRWKRRQLRRARRRAAADGHSWEQQPLVTTKVHDLVMSDGTPMKLNLEFNMIGMKEIRKCRACGQESVDGKAPKDSCRDRVARAVMES